jgi:hypothetical protein
MTPRSAALLREIDTFLDSTGMKPTNLGRGALNDPAFYGKLRKGRRLFAETEEKVRGFMSMYARIKRVA